MSFLVFRLLGYRRQVIHKNLEYCFPDYDERKRSEIERGFFKNFTDIFVETLKSISTPDKKIIKNIEMANIEVLDAYYQQNKSVLILAGHINNWEWGKYLEHFFKHQIVVTIKKLSNRFIDKYLTQSRKASTLILINNMKELGELVENDQQAKSIVFLVDQYPVPGKKTVRTKFFGKEIEFHSVAADFAKKYELDCVMMIPERYERGKYRVRFEKFNPTESASAQELVDEYVDKLESYIRRSPQSWMWTHKRFKSLIDYT